MKASTLIYTGLLLLAEATAALAQEYRPEDFLPLAVGNSWTYSHYYYDRLSHPDKEISEIATEQQVTITITHAEQIEGYTYYVFSDMPYDFPPVPYFFLAGKKVRFAEDGRLMEWRPEGEVWTFHFGPDVPQYDFDPFVPPQGYLIPPQEGDTLVTRVTSTNHIAPIGMNFMFLGHLPLMGDFRQLLGEGGDTIELPEGRSASFLQSYGLTGINTVIEAPPSDAPFLITWNAISAHYALLGGQKVTPDDLVRGWHTSVQLCTWGQLKRFIINPSREGKKP